MSNELDETVSDEIDAFTARITRLWQAELTAEQIKEIADCVRERLLEANGEA